MPRTYLVSLGCDKNRVDGETMIGTLRNAGYDVVHDPSIAEAIIVNTCGFIRDAVQESIDLILELSEHKTAGSCRALIIVGCMVQRYKDEIQSAIPEADVIIGVGEYDDIANVVAELIGQPDSVVRDISLARIAARHDDVTPHIAYVKIAEGCNNKCTYCTIPSIRGPYKSRHIADILSETRQLVSAGAREIVLVAQDTAMYGVDIYDTVKLPELLRQLAAQTDVTWIRLMYAYPEHITEELIDTMAELPQVCKYIDMPIQHSEDDIIRTMGRKSTRDGLQDLIRRLREKIPEIVIRTTLIVGFPGETARIFANMLKFVKTTGFGRLGVFPYSQEDGTPAALLPQQTRETTRQKRMQQAMELQREIHFARQESLVGKSLHVMVDSQTEAGEYIGRTQWDAYEVDTVVIFTAPEELVVGEIYTVRITESDSYDLRGEHEPTQ